MAEKQILTSSINQTFALYKFGASSLSGVVTRPDISNSACEDYEIVNPKRARLALEVFSTSALKAWKKEVAAFANTLRSIGLPWGEAVEKGQRSKGFIAIPNTRITFVEDKFSSLEDYTTRQIEEIVSSVATAKEEDKLALGKAYRDTDYPDEATIRASFRVSLDRAVIPNASEDVRCGLDAEQTKRFSEAVKEQEKDRTEHLIRSGFERLAAYADHVVDRSKKYNGGKEGSWNGELVDDLVEFAKTLGCMNIHGDAKIDELQHSIIKKFSGIKSSDLRQLDNGGKVLRNRVAKDAKEVAKGANEVLAALGDFGKRNSA